MAQVANALENDRGGSSHHDDEDEGDCCRICRCGATEDNSLFYPCKCSGSIKYVHQQCLIDWLAHSGNTHCEVCKHQFSFTPVYAKDTPSRLPWHELAIGLLKRAAAGLKVAHRVWLVSCVWLIAVPWVTCLAWRLAFLHSFAQVPRLLMERCNVLAVATDCIQGSLLSIGIVFLNIAVSSLKEHLKKAIASLEQQLLRETVPPAAVAVAPAAALPAGAEEPAAVVAAEAPVADLPASQVVGQLDQQQIAAQGDQQQAGIAAVAAEPILDPAVAAVVAEVEGVAADEDADLAAVDNDDDDAWGDVPFEELLGLQGPWLNFIETIVLVILGNAFFMAGVVYLPLNIGRLLLTAASRAFSVMTSEQQVLLQQTLSGYVQIPYAAEAVRFVLSVLAPAVADGSSGSVVSNATSAIAAAAVQRAASVVANITDAAANTTNISTVAINGTLQGLVPVPDVPQQQLHTELMPSFDSIVRELHAQLELPARADFVALSLGHCLLGTLLLVGLWLYVSLRLWRAARTRLRRMGRRPLVEVVGSTGRWLLSAASLVGQGAKLVFLLTLELGAFPLAAGLWLDICALPLTSSSLGQRGVTLSKAPFMSGCMHWVLGVGCLLLFTFLVCVVREVLRPGALPFLKDPTNPERNPIRELLDEPLVAHLGRVVQTWVGYAGLCVVIVHLPALLARALVPSLYPLRLAMFDPLTQIPADMLLLHILIPFTVEHVRVKRAVKGAVKVWLQWAGRLLSWDGYLLPASEAARPAVPPAAAAVPAVATEEAVADNPAGSSDQQQQQEEEAMGLSSRQQLPPHSSQPVEGSRDLDAGTSAAAAAGEGVPADASQQQQQPEAADHRERQRQQQQPLSQQQQPVEWYQQQSNYKYKVLGLFVCWLASMMATNFLLITLPVGLGRSLFHLLGLPFKNDLFTGAIGLITIWGSYSLAAGVATSANMRGVKAVLAAAWKWLLLTGQCGLLLVLWLGVVATMTGMLCELILLPLRLPPNQTALIYLYQDWTMGVLALKLFHLLVMIAPRREGRQPPDPDSWQAHFEAIQAAGLRNLDFNRALSKIVLPVLIQLATSLAAPYVITKGVLPLLGLPAAVLQYADLYSYLVYHSFVVLYLGVRKAHQLAVQLHNAIRDDKYLVGRQLNNFELQQQRQQQKQLQERERLEQQSSAAEGSSAASGAGHDQQQQQQQQEENQEHLPVQATA